MTHINFSSRDIELINTLGELKKAGYKPYSTKHELRKNLINKIKKSENVFEGIWGYEDTVIPDIERAILSGHNINLLGLRGQAKTRIARQMIQLLDEYIPVIKGSELNDDPMNPISRFGWDAVNENGDNTAIGWIHRDDRYTEKLATPDVSIADLIGDVDPIKAASLKLPYSDERVIHYGLVPRAHRGIFVINELPDLQPRIQVALFNILQEGDIQIRGFKLRLPLDIQFVFTANPEDYTNRGSIVTPLKDRLGSQIITHYPKSREVGMKITAQEAKLPNDSSVKIIINEWSKKLVEQIAIEARRSEYVDAKSGVSARLTITAYENLVSAAERRAMKNGEKEAYVRISDFIGIIPSITGKVELVYEGEQEGPGIVAQNLIGKAIRTMLPEIFPNPEDVRNKKESIDPYRTISAWFGKGKTLDMLNDFNSKEYKSALESITGLDSLVNKYSDVKDKNEKLFLMEFVLFGLVEYSYLSKSALVSGNQFNDLLSSMLPTFDEDEEINY
jgi:magnesium chelatase subunit I